MKSRMRQRRNNLRRNSNTRRNPIGQRKSNSQRLLILLRVMMTLCVIAIAVFGALLIINGREYSKGDAAYEQIRSILRGEKAQINKTAEATNAVASEAPDRSSQKDFSPLESINPDVVGWLFADGSPIDYPVVLGRDNEYYLTHLFTRERNKLGSLFMDYRNHGDFSDKNTVIYGHNMRDGSMFASLAKYRNQSYYDSFPAMALYTPDGDYTIEFFAGIVADGNYEFVRFGFQDGKDFLDYINSLEEKSTFKSNTVVNADDRIVTLCTCSYEFMNARYALFGRLKRLQ